MLTRHQDRLLSFDAMSGRLVCEAGVQLGDIQRTFIPQGWMLPVSPGTQFVTVGGALAHDVHGKNHHLRGSFGDHVRRLTLLRSDGTQIVCGPDTQQPWFAATVGGIGLTGLITSVELQLMRVPGPWLETETLPYEGLDGFFALADASSDWEYTVSWFDCLSARARGLFMRGRHCTTPEDAVSPRVRHLRVPFAPPFPAINAWSLALFNHTYYSLNARRQGVQCCHYQPFLYPLDHVEDWNRIYGPHGFYQYQCVIPPHDRATALEAILGEIRAARQGSFLAVLKTFGERAGLGLLSFPRPGVTLALDFPNRGEATVRLLAALDAIVAAAGGAIYLAKDARMPRALFQRGYARAEELTTFRDSRFSSAMSRRLIGD